MAKIKFTSSPGSAYEVAVGVTAEEAADAGLTTVELNYSTNPPAPVFGRYKDAPAGAALGVTVDARADTKVIGGGGVAIPPEPTTSNSKGSLVNQNDPVIHGGTGDESVHADGAEPAVRDFKADEQAIVEAATDADTLATKK